MQDEPLLYALAQDGEGLQITLIPDGHVIIDTGYVPYVRGCGANMAEAIRDTARKVLAKCSPDSPVRKALLTYDANGTFYTNQLDQLRPGGSAFRPNAWHN